MTATPEPITVIRWRCPFCRQSWAHKKPAAQHAGRCWRNPAVRGCKTCVHYESVPGGEPCFPGRPCDCNDGYETCHAGVDLLEGLKTQCPLWSMLAAPEPETTAATAGED